MDAITQVLNAIERGDPLAAEQLLPLVYDELRKLAAQRLAQEKPGQTLQATALVHEAYVRLTGNATSGGNQSWSGRSHFFAAAAEAMRRILVDAARRKNAARHGGGRLRVDLDPDAFPGVETREDLVALDSALELLAGRDPIKAELVKLRYFGGLTMTEAARALGLSDRTAGRHWKYARAWLRRAVEGAGEEI